MLIKYSSVHIYVRYIKPTTNKWDIRSSVIVKVLLAIISWMARQIHIIELALESAHQTVSNDIYIIHYMEISIHRDTSISI